MEAARSLATTFHKHGISLVYGGGTAGMMGEIARTLVDLAGPEAVHGIIPEFLLQLEREKRAPEETQFGRTSVVDDMHSRKKMMAQEVMKGGPGSGFIALSGGFGTIEEIMEMTTWNSLGLHDRGAVLYNVNDYWRGVLQQVKDGVSNGFITPANSGILQVALTAEEAVEQLRDFKPSEDRLSLKWQQV